MKVNTKADVGLNGNKLDISVWAPWVSVAFMPCLWRGRRRWRSSSVVNYGSDPILRVRIVTIGTGPSSGETAGGRENAAGGADGGIGERVRLGTLRSDIGYFVSLVVSASWWVL